MADIRLFPAQSIIFSDLFVTKTVTHAHAVCSRGFGKSHLGATAAIQACSELWEMPAYIPNKQVAIIAPTYQQVTDIYYDMLLWQLGLVDYAIKPSKDTGRIPLPNNTLLRLVSFEAIERLRGGGLYFVVNDETRDWTSGGGFKDAWESVIEPCIMTRWGPKRAAELGAPSHGRSLTITTPRGFDYNFDFHNRGEIDDRYKGYHFDYHYAPLLDPAEIERLRHTLDPIKFAREYDASFKDSGNNVFYCFDRKIHVLSKSDCVDYQRNDQGYITEDIHVCIDFNVNIQASSAAVIRGGKVIFKHEFRGSADTETLAKAIKGVFWPTVDNKEQRHCKIYVYPDPSGNAAKTSATVGKTDISILRAAGFEVLFKAKAPSIVDSVACVNRMLMSAAGDVRCYIEPHLTHLITSMERTQWVDKNPDTAAIDKKEGVEHSSDGVRYFFDYKFPIYAGTKPVSRGFGF